MLFGIFNKFGDTKQFVQEKKVYEPIPSKYFDKIMVNENSILNNKSFDELN